MEFHNLTYLDKADIGGVRNNDNNYRKYISENKNNNPKNTDGWMVPIKMLNIENRKSGNKILEANLIRRKKIVVKISKNKELLKKDYEISNELKKLKCINFAKYLGFFSCKDIINDYNKNKPLPNYFCKNNGTYNYFLFMNYYPLGSINDFRPTNINELISIINQLLESTTLAFEKMNFIHGDLHPGNILIKQTTKRTIDYEFNNLSKSVDTFGYEIVLFDFDRSSFNNNFGLFLSELSCFINLYERILIEKNIFRNSSFKNLKREFLKITNLDKLKDFIDN